MGGDPTWVLCYNAIDGLDHTLLKLEDTFTTLQQEDRKAGQQSSMQIWTQLTLAPPE